MLVNMKRECKRWQDQLKLAKQRGDALNHCGAPLMHTFGPKSERLPYYRRTTMPKITAQFLLAFTENLGRQGYDEAEQTLMDIQDFSVEDHFRYEDLPVAIPAALRKQFAALSSQRRKLEQEMEDMLAHLEDAGSKVIQRMEQDHEAKKPHCAECGQVLPPKSRKR